MVLYNFLLASVEAINDNCIFFEIAQVGNLVFYNCIFVFCCLLKSLEQTKCYFH